MFLCGSVVEHCVSSDSQGTHILMKMYNLNATVSVTLDKRINCVNVKCNLSCNVNQNFEQPLLQCSVSNGLSENILIGRFGVKETFLLVINVENSCAA